MKLSFHNSQAILLRKTQMMSEGHIYVLVRIDGRHIYCEYINLIFALSPCSSMVRTCHRGSEDYGFDSRQGLGKFSE